MKNILILLFSILISIPVIMPFFHAGYFPTHDGEWAIVRLGDMFRTLRDFQIPARYSGELNFGYGYPLFNFAYPLPYYLGVVLHVLGIGFVDAIKILFAASVFFSGLFMFYTSKLLWKSNWAGIVSSILYIYLPYRMVDLYVRGSIGESISFVLFPLLFYFLIKLVDKSSALLICGTAICLSILIMTHNIMTVLFTPIYIVFAISLIILKNKKAIKPFVLSIMLGFGLSAFFWIPAILEKSNILLSQVPIADRNLYFVTLKQFLLPGWGYGIPTGKDGFSYQLGLAHLEVFFTVLLFLLLEFSKNRKALKEHFIRIAFLLVGLISSFTFLLFEPSNSLWENLPLLSEINYPWIVLGVLGFLLSLLAGFLCRGTFNRYVAIFLGVFAIIIVFPYAKPQDYFNRADDYYLTNDATTTSSNELMPLWVKNFPSQRPANKAEIIEGKGNIENIFFNSKQVKFSVNTSEKSTVRINTIYYPGWKISIDGANVPIFHSNEKGVMDIHVFSGSHIVNGKFVETPLRFASDIISVSSFFVIVLFIIKRRKYGFS